MIAIRFAVLFLVLLGLFLFVHDKTKINAAFLPILTISGIICYTYILGLLNVLGLSAVLLVAVGLVFCGLYSFKILKGRLDVKPLFCPGIIVFLILSAYFFVLLNGVSLLQYDNFSHWGTIVKEMFYFNSFPDERTIVTFRSYPPGTACLIYPICRILGYNESHALMAQSLIISSAISALFSKAKFRNVSYCIALFITALCSVCIVSYDDTTLHTYNLLVDAVLAYVVVACLIVVYHYKHDIKKLFLINIILLSSLTLIKDSGSLFLVVICTITCILTVNNPKNRKEKVVLYNALMLVTPLSLSRVLWKAYNTKAYLHTDFYSNKFVFKPTFSSVSHLWNLSFSKYTYLGITLVLLAILSFYILRSSKHNKKLNITLTAAALIGLELFFSYFFIEVINCLSEKSSEDLDGILTKMIKALLDFNNINTKILFTVNLISLISIILLFAYKKNWQLILKTFLFTNSLGIFYFLNLYVLYAVVMNECEGNSISAFDRYLSTFVLILFLLQSLAVIHTISNQMHKKYLIAWAFLYGLAAASVMCVKSNMDKLISRPKNEHFPRHYIQKICENNKGSLPRGQKVLVYIGDIGASLGYYGYLCSYELLSQNCQVINNKHLNIGGFLEKAKNFDYLIIAKADEELRKFIKHYNLQPDIWHEQIYSVSKSLNQFRFNKLN